VRLVSLLGPVIPLLSAFRLRRRLERVKETETSDAQRDQVARDFDGNIETGFQIATLHGPLCAEPIEGVAFFVERVEIDRGGIGKENGRSGRKKNDLDNLD
jgi:translation elongation factor EF-G